VPFYNIKFLFLFLIKKIKMFLLFLFILIIIIIFIYKHFNKSGGIELKLNRKKDAAHAHELKAANFAAFIKEANLDHRLIYIGGANYSGRSHLAKMIPNHTIINTKDKKPPEIRREFREAGVSKKFVIEGMLSVEDLRRVFKGEPKNKNFIFIFVAPKKDCALKWQKATGQPRAEYDKLLEESDKLKKEYAKVYRLYVVKNDFSN
jgi:Na+-transporting methylmalonyl-CoA/oxaloacetate decarboxylase gamma subunit